MTFSVNLVLAAVVVTTVHAGNAADLSEASDLDASCYFACPDVVIPVIDQDGTIYSNACKMDAAKCKRKKKDNSLEEYERLDASRDDNASESVNKMSDSNKEDSPGNEEGGSFSPSIKIGSGTLEEASSPGDGAEDTYCPNILCPAVYSPVTDENGVTYSNKCVMQAAKCKGPRENPLEEYKRLYGKEFGVSRESGDGREFASVKDTDDSDNEMSASKKLVKSSKGPGEATKCRTKTSASEGAIGDGAPSSECATDCPDIGLPVCGSDGVEYSNPCELKAAACKNPELNIVEDEAACTISRMATQDDTAV